MPSLYLYLLQGSIIFIQPVLLISQLPLVLVHFGNNGQTRTFGAALVSVAQRKVAFYFLYGLPQSEYCPNFLSNLLCLIKNVVRLTFRAV
jgi:hypothetical protein